MDHHYPSPSTSCFIAISLMLAAPGCSGAAAAKAAKPNNPRACAELATQLCKGSKLSIGTCKSTLDLLTPDVCTSALSQVKVSLQKLAAKRRTCDDLVTKLCGDLGAESQGCSMVKESAGELSHGDCDDMHRDYDNVLAELKRQDEQNKPLPAEAQAKLTQGSGPSFGPADAKVTVVEFSDFQCPYCSRAAEVAHVIREKYGDRVRFVFRQYPLSFHENASLAAEASLAAHAQGKFWELHDKMFAHQEKLDRGSLEAYAQEVGVDMTLFKTALDEQQYKTSVDAEVGLGEEIAVDGTPTMFINGQRIGNPTSIESVSGAIEQALTSAKAKG